MGFSHQQCAFHQLRGQYVIFLATLWEIYLSIPGATQFQIPTKDRTVDFLCVPNARLLRDRTLQSFQTDSEDIRLRLLVWPQSFRHLRLRISYVGAKVLFTHNVEVSGLRGFSRRSARLPGWA